MEKISQLLMCVLAIALALFIVGCTKSNAALNPENGAAASMTAIQTATPPGAQAPTANSDDKVPRIKAPDAMKEVSDGKAVIIDVRGTEPYKIGHIRGALDIPITKLEAKDFSGLPKD